MNTLEKLQKLARVGKGMDYQTRQRVLKMYGSMKWAFQDMGAVVKDGQAIFMEYYGMEEASFIKKNYQRYVAE